MQFKVARVRVNAVVVRNALDLLTEIAAPMSVALLVDRGVLTLSTCGDGRWWALVDVSADGDVADRVSATLPRMELRQAVDAEAVLVPEATCSVTIVDEDVVRYGAFALTAMGDAHPEPPSIDGVRIAVATASVENGRLVLPDGRVLVAPSASVERFTARGIDTVEVVDGGSFPCLVGVERAGTAELILIAVAEWVHPG